MATYNNGLYTPFTPAVAATPAAPASLTLATPLFSVPTTTPVANTKSVNVATTSRETTATTAAASSAAASPIPETTTSSNPSSTALIPFFILSGIIVVVVILCVLWRRRKKLRSWKRTRVEQDDAFDPDEWSEKGSSTFKAVGYTPDADDLEYGDRQSYTSKYGGMARSQSTYPDEKSERGWSWGTQREIEEKRAPDLDQLLAEARARYSPDEIETMAEERENRTSAKLYRAGSAIYSSLSIASSRLSGRSGRMAVPTADDYDEYGARRPQSIRTPAADSSYAGTPTGLDVRYEAEDGHEISMLSKHDLRMPEAVAENTATVTRSVRRWTLQDAPVQSAPITPTRSLPPVPRTPRNNLPALLQTGMLSPSGMSSPSSSGVPSQLLFSSGSTQRSRSVKYTPNAELSKPLSVGALASLMFPSDEDLQAAQHRKRLEDPFTNLPLASAMRRKANASRTEESPARALSQVNRIVREAASKRSSASPGSLDDLVDALARSDID